MVILSYRNKLAFASFAINKYFNAIFQFFQPFFRISKASAKQTCKGAKYLLN